MSRRSELLYELTSYGNGYVPQTSANGEISWVKQGESQENLNTSDILARMLPLVNELQGIIIEELGAAPDSITSNSQE